MALFNPCMKFEILGGQMPIFEVLRSAILGLYPKYVSGLVQALIQVDKWDYIKNPSHELKNFFFLGFL